MKTRMEDDNKKWIAVVSNKAEIEELGVGFNMRQNFYSNLHDFENILHRIELDLMTNLHNGLKEPIEVKIVEVKSSLP